MTYSNGSVTREPPEPAWRRCCSRSICRSCENGKLSSVSRSPMSTASPSSPVSSAFAERLILTDRPTAVRWRILTWIVVASVVAYLLRFNLSVAGPSMMRDLGLTEAQLGLVLGAFAWCYGLFQGPAGLIGERV